MQKFKTAIALLCILLSVSLFSGCSMIGKIVTLPIKAIFSLQNDSDESEGTKTDTEAETDNEDSKDVQGETEMDSKAVPTPTPAPTSAQTQAAEIRLEYMRRANDIATYASQTSSETTDQQSMNKHSYEVFQRWDALLNEVYQYLKKTMPANEFQKLQEEEIQWIKEKEAAIKKAGAEYEGGSMQPLIENTTATNYTSSRCYYLISLIN